MLGNRRQYRNPPISEALCEFRFAPGARWNATIPGHIHQELAKDYEGDPQNHTGYRVELQASDGAAPSPVVREEATRVQLPSADGSRMVGIAPHSLSVHVFRPYPGWEKFRPKIEKALKAYVSVARPKGINRLGVRYVNRILVPRDGADARHYIGTAPSPGGSLADRLAAFFNRLEYWLEDATKLLVTSGTIEAPSGKTGFLLDIDAIREGPPMVTVEDAMRVVDLLRDHERTAFEELITEQSRELFDAAEPRTD